MTVESEFLTLSADQLRQLMGRVDTCVEKLTPDQIWARGSESQNAVGNLLLHLDGNLRQWILQGVGGHPGTRDRDGEFAAGVTADHGPAAGELSGRLRATVEEAASLIGALPPPRLLERLTIQGYEVTVLGAIYHVVEHFAGHAFQIMFMTKQFTGADLGFYAHLSGAKASKSLP